jgi:hypothetical protein
MSAILSMIRNDQSDQERPAAVRSVPPLACNVWENWESKNSPNFAVA